MVYCNRYRLKLSKSDYQCLAVNGEQMSHFIAPDTKAGIQKLYVLVGGREVLYIGITSQSMSSRLRSGFTADGTNGYHGYKWIGKIEQADLLVWCFPNEEQSIIEAVEGELVYLIRNRTGKWPKYQMEIHFHNARPCRQENSCNIRYTW